MTDDLTIEVCVDTEAAMIVAVISGEIDLSNATRLHRELTAGHDPNHALMIDLTDVTYIDSAGLNVLNQIAFSHHALGSGFGVAYLQGSIAEGLLRVSPLPPHVSTGTPDDVVESLTAGCEALSD